MNTKKQLRQQLQQQAQQIAKIEHRIARIEDTHSNINESLNRESSKNHHHSKEIDEIFKRLRILDPNEYDPKDAELIDVSASRAGKELPSILQRLEKLEPKRKHEHRKPKQPKPATSKTNPPTAPATPKNPKLPATTARTRPTRRRPATNQKHQRRRA